MSKKMWFFLGFLTFWAGASVLTAQTASDMDALLEKQAVSYGDAARFILPAAGVLPDNTGAGAAFDDAQAAGWIPSGVSAGDEASLAGVSLLVMKAFNMKGGLLYSLFSSPRYAYRELVYRKLLQGRVDPAMKVKGDYLLYVIGRVLDFHGETGEAND